MKIREATTNDVAAIARFQRLMAEETEDINLDRDVVLKGVQRVLDDPSLGFYLVVEEEGKVQASMLLTPEWSDWRNSCFLWIQSLYVIPEKRHRGLFKKLYAHVQELVNRSEEYAGLKLYVAKENIQAREVYKRVGMTKSHYQLFEWNKYNY